MAFFKRGAAAKKKGPIGNKKPKKSGDAAARRAKKPTADDEISSDSDAFVENVDEGTDDEVFEDAQAKAFREAKRVLEKLKADDELRADEAEGEDEDLDAISHRLKVDAVHQTTTAHRRIADKVVVSDDVAAAYRPHRFAPVCVALSNDGRFVVSCSKDGSIVKFDLQTKKKVGRIVLDKKDPHTHKGPIVRIWSLDTLKHVKDFPGHRGPITSLVFRQGSNDLYSASTDKSVRSWNLDQMGFVEIMFGHSEPVSQLDMLNKPRLLSAGTTDRTIHVFKIEHSSQLVFNGLTDCTSIDAVSMINDDHYVSGQMDGSLYVWSVFKKKPVCVVRNAHGTHEDGHARWITAVRALPFSDLVASGSSDGHLKLWKVGENYKTLTLVCECDIDGFINDIRFGADGRTVVLAVGQEHRAGRWWTIREARNAIVVLTLRTTSGERGALSNGAPRDVEMAEA
ncbi:WD domain, G-beta repeat protein [Aphelenchoides fujianensis]|nr:WD domain, G-beta repeat protein [Aphelenchoides fujianensis]